VQCNTPCARALRQCTPGSSPRQAYALATGAAGRYHVGAGVLCGGADLWPADDGAATAFPLSVSSSSHTRDQLPCLRLVRVVANALPSSCLWRSARRHDRHSHRCPLGGSRQPTVSRCGTIPVRAPGPPRCIRPRGWSMSWKMTGINAPSIVRDSYLRRPSSISSHGALRPRTTMMQPRGLRCGTLTATWALVRRAQAR
jgi:hypothetical protein